MKKLKRMLGFVSLLAILMLFIWTLWANTALELNSYTLESAALPQSFDGYRIAHISDLHNCELDKGNQKLLDMLKKAQPDIIAITGDLIDSRTTKVEIALDFAQQAMQIAPCYYVPGNHESMIEEYTALKNGLTELGVFVLEDQVLTLTSGAESIALMGVIDPDFEGADTEKALDALYDPQYFTVLLSHRPELFDLYAAKKIDLVLSGHAHGGQFRLPGIGGLFAPGQGFLPKYDSGLCTQEGTTMAVSRGIGNSLFPLRFNNRPEVILIELKSTQ